MSYQVLARKWRPQTFADVVGQEHVLTALANGLSLGRIHHAYLFSGTRGGENLHRAFARKRVEL
jgi:DNA polymerase-3 subunit gamma/tau